MKMKIYVVGRYGKNYPCWIKDYELVDNQRDADIVYFTGGEDVSPDLYGCKKHESTNNNPARDEYEKACFDAMKPNQIAIGTCRGNQFLTVVNGGILVQNCSNHALWGTHEITNGKDKYQITSTHHQMAYPFYMDKTHYDILYWAEGLSDIYQGDKIDPSLINKEPEIIYYHVPGKPKCLGIQGHPEMMYPGNLWDMLNKILLDIWI